MAVSLAPTDWRFPESSSSAPIMDHHQPNKLASSSAASSSSKSVTTPPTTTPGAGGARDSPHQHRATPSPHSESGSKQSPSPNGQFMPYGANVPPQQQQQWSPQQQQQAGFGFPGMYGYFPQQQQGQPGAQFSPPFDPQQAANAQQFQQWAAYQQMMFNAQQQHQIAAAVAAGMIPRQRTGSSPQSPPDFNPNSFMVNGGAGPNMQQLAPGMMNNSGPFPSPPMMAFPNGPGASGASSGRGSAASEPSTNQTFHPYRRTPGSRSTSGTGSPASANNNNNSASSSPTIAGLPASAFPPLGAPQPPQAPYARERTNSNSSANSSRSSRSGAGNNRVPPGGRSGGSPAQSGPQSRTATSTAGPNGRSTPSHGGRPSDSGPNGTRPSGARQGSTASNANTPQPPSQPRARTSSSSSASSSPSSPSNASPALPAVGAGSQNQSGSVRARAPPRPSPLSQQSSVSADAPVLSNASKRLSRDDSELRAYGETVHVHTPRSAGLKARMRRALSLAPSGALDEEGKAEPPTPKPTTRTTPIPAVAAIVPAAVAASKNGKEPAHVAPVLAAQKKKAPIVAASVQAVPMSPTTPTSAHSGSTIGANTAGASSITPPGSPGDLHDDNASDAPPDPSIRSTKLKKSKAGSLFNRKWNASTDNISLSSTVSSASLMIRKIGSVGALARRKSLTGITNLFKDKDKKEKSKDKDKDKADKKGKAGVSAAGLSQVHAEFERGELSASGSDEMVGLSPAARLARQHTLRTNAEAAARAKQAELQRQQELQQQQQQQQQAQYVASNSVSGRHVRTFSEDSNEDGFQHVNYSGRQTPNSFDEAEEDEEDEFDDDGDVTVRHDSLDIENEPWAQNIRRSIERTMVPAKGILKRPGTYNQEEDLKLNRSHSLQRSRANSYDTIALNRRSNEPGPLARIPSADPDHIDGLQPHGESDGMLPPLNLSDISNFSDSPISSMTNLAASASAPSMNGDKNPSVYLRPNMNSSAPTLTLLSKTDENATSARSQTAPAPSSKKITFAANLHVYDTFSPGMYDRRSEPATCNYLTPALAQRIKEELNSFKMEEMEVHHASRAHTQFFV